MRHQSASMYTPVYSDMSLSHHEICNNEYIYIYINICIYVWMRIMQHILFHPLYKPKCAMVEFRIALPFNTLSLNGSGTPYFVVRPQWFKGNVQGHVYASCLVQAPRKWHVVESIITQYLNHICSFWNNINHEMPFELAEYSLSI